MDAAVGVGEAIDDEAAGSFASQLYSSIAFGLPISTAFAQATLQVQLSQGAESGAPQLFVADGVDAEELFLARPEGADEDDPRPLLLTERMEQCVV